MLRFTVGTDLHSEARRLFDERLKPTLLATAARIVPCVLQPHLLVTNHAVASAKATEITHLLRRWREGDRDAFDAMLPQVYIQDRSHFFAVASTAMRRILIEHAKYRPLEEVAQVLGTSAPTVMRDLRIALAWLAHDMG